MIDDALTIARLSPDSLLRRRFIEYCLRGERYIDYPRALEYIRQNPDPDDWGVSLMSAGPHDAAHGYEIQLSVLREDAWQLLKLRVCGQAEYREFMRGFAAWYEREYPLAHHAPTQA